jgi:hypothetical protein
MVQRLAVIGFIVAVIVAALFFVQMQNANNQYNAAVTQQAAADARRRGAEADQSTAVAQVAVAQTAQGRSDVARATAEAQMNQAATRQAAAQAAQATAEAQAVEAQAGQAEATAQVATLNAQLSVNGTQIAEATAQLATVQAQLNAEATNEILLGMMLGTATAQVDLAQFAQAAAEQDRLQALTQVWAGATLQARALSQISTLEARLAVSQGTPAATPTLAPTVISELSPTPAPGAAASATPSANATAGTTFTSQDGSITFSIPQGWVAQEFQNGVVVGTSQAAIESSGPLKTGEFIVSLVIGPINSLPGVAGKPGVQDVARAYGSRLASQANITMPPPTALSVGARNAARIEVPLKDVQASIVAVDLEGGNFVLALAFSAPGELSQFEPTLLAILESVQYKA